MQSCFSFPLLFLRYPHSDNLKWTVANRRQVKTPLIQVSSCDRLITQACVVLRAVEVKLTSQSQNGQPPILQNKHLRMKTTCECYSFCILSSVDRERNHMYGVNSQPAPQHSFFA